MTMQSAFENKKSAMEIVTCMFDKEGAWRAAGYSIK